MLVVLDGVVREGCGVSGLRAEFEKFHAENPHVYRLFERFALRAINAGRPRLGAKAIFERLRWYTTVETRSSDDLKLNNNYTPFYARMFEEQHPDYAGFFSKRMSAADECFGHSFDEAGQGAFL